MIQERRTPRQGDDLFWFNEAKQAHARVARLRNMLTLLIEAGHTACQPSHCLIAATREDLKALDSA